MYDSHSPDFLEVILGIQELRRHTLVARDELQRLHPDWPAEVDARLTAYAKLVNTLNSA